MPDAADSDPGLLEYARMLRGRWPRIAAATVAGAVIGLLVGWLTPRTYEATATVGLRSITGGELRPTAVANARRLLEHRTPAARVVTELGLDREPRRLTAERFLVEHLRTEPVRNSDLVQVYVRLDDPELAARAANRFTEEAIALNRTLIEKDVASAQRYLEGQVQQARATTERLEQDILAYRQKAQIDLSRQDAERALRQRERALASGARGTNGQLAELNALYDKEAGLNKLEADLKVAQSVYRDVVKRKENARIEVLGRFVELDMQEPATPPERARAPNLAWNAALGAAVGFLVGTLLFLGTAVVSRLR